MLVAAGIVIQWWTDAFRLLIVPFVASHLYLAVATARVPPGRLGRLALLPPVVFLALLVGVFALSFVAAAGLMTLPLLGDLALEPPGIASPAGDRSPPRGNTVFGAVTGNRILAVMLLSIAVALAARRLAPALQARLERAFRAVAQMSLVLVEWLLLAAPLALFAVGLSLGVRSGFQVGGALLAFTVLMSVVLLAALASLYPVAAWLGGVPLGRFARAVWPAQVTAAATRSSVATLPALMVGAETGLGLSTATAGYVLPLATSLLKLSRGVSEPVTLLFLAGLLDISLSLEQLVVFTVGMILLSSSSPGLPRVTSGTRSMPLYVAVGIPPEYVVLLAATTAVTDVLMTVLNSTGYLTAAVVVARLAPEGMALELRHQPLP